MITKSRTTAIVVDTSRISQGTLKVAIPYVKHFQKYNLKMNKNTIKNVQCDKGKIYNLKDTVFIVPCRRLSKTKTDIVDDEYTELQKKGGQA